MKEAIYYKRHRTLEFWTSHNTTTYMYCDSLERARKIIKNLPIEQTLKKA